MDSNANLKARVTLTPEKSHIVLSLFMILGGVAMVVGFYFMHANRADFWVPLLFAVGFFIFGGFAWFHSHKHLDLQGASPTSISAHKDGRLEILADSRTFLSPDSLMAVTNILSLITNRRPLPEADGLVDKSGNPILASQDQAVAQVLEINKLGESLAHEVLGPAASLVQSNYIDQPNTDTIGPADEIALHTNVSSDGSAVQ